jgi:hypothetical protein
MNNNNPHADPDMTLGAVEPSRPEEDADGNVASPNEQLDHRFQDAMNKSSDSGLPGTGQTSEFSMEQHGENELQKDTADPVSRDKDSDAETNSDPGETQPPNPRRSEG